MRVLDLSYATWKSLVQAAGWTTYYKVGPRANSAFVWAGTAGHPAKALVGSDDHADWNSVFQPTATLVVNEDEALAEIIKGSLGSRFGENRSSDGTLRTASQMLIPGQSAFQRHDNGTEQMNINGEAVGTPVNLWNGTGGGDTGADWTVAGTGSEQAAADAGTGTNGWDTGVTAQNDTTTFDNGSMTDVVGTYSELKFMLQPKAWPASSRLRVGFLDASNTLVGNWRRVENYTANMDLDVYQQVSIPVSDFNLTGDVQKLRFQYGTTAGQHHYFDDIALVPSGGGGPYRFQVKAPVDECYHVAMMVFMVSGASTGWEDGTFANIPSLTNGLILRQRRLSDGEIIWKFNSKDNTDLFGRYHPQDDIEFADGNLLVGFMVKPGKASVIVTDDTVLEFVVRDDLSGLSNARGFAHYGIEIAS
jgi:hypothetical protein